MQKEIILNNSDRKIDEEYTVVKSILAECCANCRLQDNCEAIKQIKEQSNTILTKLVCSDFI